METREEGIQDRRERMGKRGDVHGKEKGTELRRGGEWNGEEREGKTGKRRV